MATASTAITPQSQCDVWSAGVLSCEQKVIIPLVLSVGTPSCESQVSELARVSWSIGWALTMPRAREVRKVSRTLLGSRFEAPIQWVHSEISS